MNALTQLQILAQTAQTDCEQLPDILRAILDSGTSHEVFTSVVQNAHIEAIDQWCTYLLENSEACLGELLFAALSSEQKKSLEKCSSVRLPVALIGEYHQSEWIEVLQQHWPEMIDLCVENAVRIFEKQATSEKSILALMPSLGRTGLITGIQEKVLLSYIDNITPAQFTRYMHANTANNREANEFLVAHHQKAQLTEATAPYIQNRTPRRIKI